MHKKAGNLFSEWALALRRSIGEPAPAPASSVPTSPTPWAKASSPPAPAAPPPTSPASALKKAASAASKSTGEQTKRQAEAAEIADNFAASDAGGNVIQGMDFF